MGFALDLGGLMRRAGLASPTPEPTPAPASNDSTPPASPANRLTTAPDVSHLATLAGVAAPVDNPPEPPELRGSPANDDPAPDPPHRLRRVWLARMSMLGMDEGKALALADRLESRDFDGDDRRACVECSHLGNGGRCLAAAAGRLRNTDRRHEPVLDVLQRCEGFGLRKGMQ